MYAIVDIETTGGSSNTEKITEIAIFVHNGKKVVEEFSTLINPEKTIPPFITTLTGITNEMVADAPKFYEVAKKIVEITRDNVFVAHNANFDYRFVKSEFKRLGFDFTREQMCTLKLSRKLLPGHRSYSLGNLCKSLDISITDRHRAAGDALATVRLLELLLANKKKNGSDQAIKSAYTFNTGHLHPGLDISSVDNLPEETGVYFLSNQHNQVIYIGKSKNIRKRVLSHLNNTSSKRAMDMCAQTAAVDFELTGSELVALLVESSEIKKHAPRFNRAQRRKGMNYGLFTSKDERGYIRLMIDKTGSRINEDPHTCFSSLDEARSVVSRMIERYWLCQKLCGMYQTDGACFHYGIRQCNGACIGKEAVAVYNNRVMKALSNYYYEHRNFLIVDKGRDPEERSVVQVGNGKYIGFGFIDVRESYLQLEHIMDCIKIYEDHKDIHRIIRSYLHRNNVEKIIRY